MKKVSLGICAALLAALALAGCTSTSSSAPASTPASAPASTPASMPESAPASVPASTPASAPESTPADSSARVSINGNKVTTDAYTFELPDGFTAISEDPVSAAAEDGSQIIVLRYESSGVLADATEEDLQGWIAADVDDAGGTLTIKDSALMEVSGYPAATVTITGTTPDGGEVVQTQVRVDNGTHEYYFDFVDATGDWTDAFAASIDSISFD